VSSVSITLGIAMIGGVARQKNREVAILDLNVSDEWMRDLEEKIKEFRPDLIGITFTTPLVGVANEIALISRSLLGNEVLVIGGGPHATALPEETLAQTVFDALAIGEAEDSFARFLDNEDFSRVPGWVYKSRGNIVFTGSHPLIHDLNHLPYAAIDIFPVEQYIYPPLSAKENPVCLLETSRGCYARCTFCSKNVFGYKIRLKSSKRIVDEIEYILLHGYREIHLSDDLFTADMEHAKSTCKEIISRRLKFPWVPRSGIRVDRITIELLELMREAGCYHIPFGIESGDQGILDSMRKGITIQQVREAVSMAKLVEMETTGYFIVGFPGETRDTIIQTIEFALELELDHIKFSTFVPLPGTPIFKQLWSEGRIISRDWSKFTYSTPPWELYENPTLERNVLESLTFNGYPFLEILNRSLHRATGYRTEC
jgi:radical SAM superfamily enzyme YgiQ (UPF0313 family)